MKILMTMMLMLGIAACSSTPNRESTAEYLDNSAISGKIKSQLLGSSLTAGTSIDVESYKGTVILSGFVKTDEQKERALEIAKGTKGVRDVKDAIYVRSDVTEEMAE